MASQSQRDTFPGFLQRNGLRRIFYPNAGADVGVLRFPANRLSIELHVKILRFQRLF